MLINTTFLKYNKVPLFCILLSGLFYWSFAYDLARTDAIKLVTLYTALFALAYVLKRMVGFNFRFLVVASILFRLAFIVATPNLSQDFYRFIWDGQLILSGLNPYLTTPSFHMDIGMLSNFPNQVELFIGMGQLNASHYSNYPPLNQLCFVIANLFPGKSILSSVIGLRIIIILADIGIIYFGKKLLDALKLPSSRIWWYALNPFIIIELTGNLHFEGVMLFFLLWSLYLLHSGKWMWSTLILACSISVKLIPLMFLPVLFWWFKPKALHLQNSKAKIQRLPNFKKLILYYTVVISATLILFLPFFSLEFITNYSQTVGLWFTNFEFNGSIYYLTREIGYWLTGYNQIGIIGKILPLITVGIILYLSFFKKNNTLPKLVTSMVLVFTMYLFLSTTVHPWYLATLVLLCVFTNYRFPLVWSFVIILSYLSYLQIGSAEKSENLWIIGLEYIVVFGVFTYEVILKKRLLVS